METKPIQVEEEVWKKLMLLRMDLKLPNISAVIKKLLKEKKNEK